MYRVIINADDFGLSKGINKGIIRGYREGVLTSASLIVNMPGFEDAVSLIRENPGLDIGLHINFFRGTPILSVYKVRSLINKKGRFLGNIFKIAAGVYRRRLSLTELEAESDAQIKKALDRGINITHLDSEKHLHLISKVYKIIVKLAKKYGINKIRNINEYPYVLKFMPSDTSILSSSLCKTSLLQFLSKRAKRINSIYSIKTADYSFGIMDTGKMTLEKYERLFNCLKSGTTEISCHPGYIDEEWLRPPLNTEKYYINLSRERELDTLLSARLKEIIRDSDIELINYAQL